MQRRVAKREQRALQLGETHAAAVSAPAHAPEHSAATSAASRTPLRTLKLCAPAPATRTAGVVAEEALAKVAVAEALVPSQEVTVTWGCGGLGTVGEGEEQGVQASLSKAHPRSLNSNRLFSPGRSRQGPCSHALPGNSP